MSHFKMRHVTSRLARQGFAIERTFVDAVSISRKRVYIGVVLSGEVDPEAAAFDIDAAVGKFASVIECRRGEESGKVTCLLAVYLPKLALMVEHEDLQARLVVNGLSETAQAGTY